MQTLEYQAVTHRGCVRPHNEDSVLARPPVFVVADGVGGAAAGEVASANVVDEFARLAEAPVISDADVAGALQRVHDRIRSYNLDHQVHSATTAAGAVVLQLAPGQYYWLFFNIGDSRVYRRVGTLGQSLTQVSVDHSRVQELVDTGEISPAEAGQHPDRNIVTRALGAEAEIKPDFWLMPVHAGERIVLCSDGLLGDSPGAEVKFLIKEVPGAATVARQLVELALRHGARDNVSVIVIDVPNSLDEVDSSVSMAETVLTARRTP